MKKARLILAMVASAGLLLTACQGGGQKTVGPSVSAVAGETAMALNTEGTAPSGADIDPEVPTIRFISKGSILPSAGGLDLLFGSVSYAQAQVRVKKVFSNNILQFLQLDDYETRYELYIVAGSVVDTTIVLGDKNADHIREYRTYGLSLEDLIKPEPGAI